VARRIALLKEQIEEVRRHRERYRQRRRQSGIPVVSLVGYTNAGKSTLLNALTSSSVLAEQRMFATLDPTARRLRLPRDQEVIINDTVGFIRDLPPDLLAAFRATIEEISDSDLLIHLVDAASPRVTQQIESVERILGDLQLTKIPRLVVFNKSDLIAPEALDALLRQTGQNGARECLAISALRGATLVPMIERVGEILARDLVTRHEDKSSRIEPEAELIGSAVR
jgi:GTP-binding protein HflX